MRLFLSPLVFTAALLLSACSQDRVVQVTNEAGEPIGDATVISQGLALQGAERRTGTNGRVILGEVMGERWILISKDGFGTQRFPVPAEWPLQVVLQRSGAPIQ